MLAHKKFYSLGMPIKNILTMYISDPIHIFWKDISGKYLGYNDVPLKYIQKKTGLTNFTNKNCTEIFLPLEARLIAANDKEIIKKTSTEFFIESTFNQECLSIKSQLIDSANKTIGSFGISFYLDEINLAKIVNIINKLKLTPQSNWITRSFIINTQLISKREKECIHYMLKGMSTKEIAKMLNISTRTVECHIEHIKNKLGCSTRLQIVNRVFEDINFKF